MDNTSNLTLQHTYIKKDNYTEKYTSQASAESEIGEYGFGVEHQHPHLEPIYDSIYDELLMNNPHWYCLWF